MDKLIPDRFEINPNFLFCRDNSVVIGISSHEFVPHGLLRANVTPRAVKITRIFDLINELKKKKGNRDASNFYAAGR